MASVDYAVRNCSTYIQGGLEIYTTTTGDTTTVYAKLYMRRTNSYGYDTYQPGSTAKITIDGSQSSTTSELRVRGSQQNVWQGPYLTASKTFTGDSKKITISWETNGGTYLTGSGSTDYIVPASYVAPSGLNVSITSKTYNSATLAVSISSYGIPASASGRYIEAAILAQNSYGNSYRYATASNTTSATVTVNNSSPTGSTALTIQGNKKYWYGGYATNTQRSISKVQGEIYLPCPPMSALTASGTYTYTRYNEVTTSISYTRQSDGGAETRTGQYRYSTNNGQSWVGWTNFGTVTNTTGSFTLTLPTATNILLQARLSTPNGGVSDSIQTTFTTPATHTIEFNNFDYADINPDTVAITGDNQVFIQKQSIPQVTIKVADKATITDGVPATLDRYVATLVTEQISINYSDSQDVSGTFTKNATNSHGTKELVVGARDSLSATQNVRKNVEIIPWSAPTLELSYVRKDQQGHIKVFIEGTYAPLVVGGVEKNSLEASYAVNDGERIPFELTYSNGRISSEIEIDEVDYNAIYYVSIFVKDAFVETQADLEVSNIEKGKILHPVEYDIEVWDWHTNSYIMDLSHIIAGSLNIRWTLNDIEELSFDVDLATFEKQCNLLGRDPRDMLVPYIHDIRIRRNGEYVVGCQIVEANISLTANSDPKLQVKATGYLNCFKDRYIDAPWSGYSYSEIAKKLVTYGQKADSLIRNPTIDIDTSYWLPIVGAIAKVTASPAPHSGNGCLKITNSSANAHLTLGSQMQVPAGTPIKIDFWMQSSGAITVYERELATQTNNQRTIQTYPTAVGATWTHWVLDTYTTRFDNGYLVIDSTNGGSTSNYMALDDFQVFRVDDEDALHNFNIVLGTDTATATQQKTRQRNYELQNIKDAIMDLTSLEDDNFDFEFTYDRHFNLYEQKGETKQDLALDYPGNVTAMEIFQSGANLANKIQNIGSGIGDERLEVWASDYSSRLKYGTRENVVTNSNVSLADTLQAQAEGLLANSRELERTLSITIENGTINCGNLKTGDIVPFKIGHKYLKSGGYAIIGELEGWYRVKAINVSVSQDSVENLKLTLELVQGFRDVNLSFDGTGTENVPGYGGLATAPLGPITIKSTELPYYVPEPTMSSGYTFAGWTCAKLGITEPTKNFIIPRSASGNISLRLNCSNKVRVDLNAQVNGSMVYSNIPATCDVYIDGTQVATGVRDYDKNDVAVGSTIEFRNIVPDSGYRNAGPSVYSFTINKGWTNSFNIILEST